jgi:hypothetical protein
MSSVRDRQLQQARELDRLSTVLINAGVQVVKRNPIKSSLYVLGLLLCLLFNGFSVTKTHEEAYERALDKIDYDKLYSAADTYFDARRKYEQSRGWFSCNQKCQTLKKLADFTHATYQEELRKEREATAEAKSYLGLFSKHGVGETRNLFWNKFAQGRGFAQRQSKWDALFLGMRAIGRNESMIEYLLNVLMNLLMNFTVGVFMAVVGFIFSLYSVITSYQAPLSQALPFFLLASLSALSFAMTWIIGLYMAAAGTVYAGAKIAASTARLQNREQARHHVRYD